MTIVIIILPTQRAMWTANEVVCRNVLHKQRCFYYYSRAETAGIVVSRVLSPQEETICLASALAGDHDPPREEGC